MKTPSGAWVAQSDKTEFHMRRDMCTSVCNGGGFWPQHIACGAKIVGVIGPRRSKQAIQDGDTLILARDGEIFYTPPIQIRKPCEAKEKRHLEHLREQEVQPTH